MVWVESDTTDLRPGSQLPPACVAHGLVSHFCLASSTSLVVVEVPSFSVLHSFTSYDYSGIYLSVLLLVGPWVVSSLGLQ